MQALNSVLIIGLASEIDGFLSIRKVVEEHARGDVTLLVIPLRERKLGSLDRFCGQPARVHRRLARRLGVGEQLCEAPGRAN